MYLCCQNLAIQKKDIIMYLEFIKDIFQPNDYICVECGNDKTEGHIVKISSDLIAIKTSAGVVIKKDADITNVYSIDRTEEEPHSSVSEKEMSVDANAISQEFPTEDMLDLPSPEQDDSLDTVEEQTIPVSHPVSTSFQTTEKAEGKDTIYETPKPQVKVVGYIDLSKIKDPRKKKNTNTANNTVSDSSKSETIAPSPQTASQEKKIIESRTASLNTAQIENKINGLLQSGKAIEALALINDYLKQDNCVGKFKSSLLLKRAQTYSALSDYEAAKVAYTELIDYNETIKSPTNNLSHLYTELARLQNLTEESKDVILSTLTKALKYNPSNSYASTLFEQINSGNYQIKTNNTEDNQLLLDSEELSTTISKMIDIDIKEHLFSHEKIIKNGGTSTPSIAKSIYEEAKRTKDVDMSERYPVYLEAAKAYSILPVGSYDIQEYLESVAYYAILKGNSLFIRFKKILAEDTPNIVMLTHIKDSACSYYIESLNLLSNIEGEHLLTILANYLKMNIALVNVQKGEQPNISGQFDKVFFNCVSSSDNNINLIAWATIVAIGTASPKAWNKLTGIKGGTRGLYRVMTSPEKRQSIYSILNRINDDPVNTDLLPGEFLKQSFANRVKRNKQFRDVLAKVLKADFNIHMLTSLDALWKGIPDYMDLLSETDQESKKIGDKVLRNLLPYTSRQSQIERTNLLYQAQDDLEKQIAFINDNTTYYGRTFFFPLFTTWRTIIQQNLKEKISKTLPVLQVIPDPHYILKDGADLLVNLIIKNIGESTAEGYHLNVSLTSLNNGSVIKGKSKEDKEIPVGSYFDKKMSLPQEFNDCTSLDIVAEISAEYQGELTTAQQYRYTLELEPETSLTEEEIMWKDGPKMSGVLFKGRQDIMGRLTRHYLSVERDKPYILYGLTRTGKSSILLNLEKDLTGKSFLKEGERFDLISFEWDLSEASGYGNAKDMWQYLLRDTLYDELGKYLTVPFRAELDMSEYPRAKDFKKILQYLKQCKKHPMFFVDEFSHIKILLDKNIINTSFLHSLRQYSLEGLASFIFAGTYDIKELIKDPKYAITGQLVHTIEEQINEIDPISAEDLVNVMKEKLTFTEEAIKHIHLLSGDVPYFIQIICKFCGFYAVEKKRRNIGKPELENVVKILTGETDGEKDSLVKVLPKTIFQNNLYSPQDKKEVNVLISSLCYLNENIEVPRSVSTQELQELWSKNGIEAYRPKLAEAITLLLERKVLVQSEDEFIPVYRLSVDLFRRWWKVHYPDIKLEITTIQ